MSYRHATAQFSPRVNLVVGPNGSGKSTLLAGIVLGLGGKPRLLKKGRLREFVNRETNERGPHEAYVQVILAGFDNPDDPADNIKIKREIHRFDDKSNYFINGEKTTEKEVLKLVKRLKICVESHLQFLPQEVMKKTKN